MSTATGLDMWRNVSSFLSWSTFLLAILVSMVVGRRSRAKSSKDVKKSPGPYPLPLLGNLMTFFALQKRPDLELIALAKKHGKFCMLWFGSNPVMVVSSPAVAKELMDRRGNIYSSRPEQNEFRAKAWPWRLVTTPTGETFRLLRKLYHNLLGPQQSAEFRKYQDFEAIQVLQGLTQEPDKFLMHMEKFAISVIFSAVYGVRLVSLDHPIMVEFYHTWETMLNYFQPGTLLIDFFPLLQSLPEFMQPWLKLARQLRKTELKLHSAFLRRLRTQVEANDAPVCFGAHLIKAQAREGFSDSQACDILAMLIGAGADTTSSYLQSFLKVMALHPDVVSKAHEELDHVVGRDRLPTWEDEANLPYIRAVIKEVHRWAPIGSLGVPHATSGADVYEGTPVPKGTIVFPNLTVLSRSPECYTEPDKFEPARFIGDNLDASASALHPDYKRRDHFHYGFGRRLCQGIFVAEASLYIVVARVLWAFDIKPHEDEPLLDMNAKLPGLVTKPKPYRVRVESRGSQFDKVVAQAVEDAKTDILDFDDVKAQLF